MLGATARERISWWAVLHPQASPWPCCKRSSGLWSCDLPSTVELQCLVCSSGGVGFPFFFSHPEFAHRLGKPVVAHRSRNREYSQRFVGSFLSLDSFLSL